MRQVADERHQEPGQPRGSERHSYLHRLRMHMQERGMHVHGKKNPVKQKKAGRGEFMRHAAVMLVQSGELPCRFYYYCMVRKRHEKKIQVKERERETQKNDRETRKIG